VPLSHRAKVHAKASISTQDGRSAIAGNITLQQGRRIQPRAEKHPRGQPWHRASDRICCLASFDRSGQAVIMHINSGYSAEIWTSCARSFSISALFDKDLWFSGNGLLNRRTGISLYRGFESRPLRFSVAKGSCSLLNCLFYKDLSPLSNSLIFTVSVPCMATSEANLKISSDKSLILANMKGVHGIKTAILFDNQM